MFRFSSALSTATLTTSLCLSLAGCASSGGDAGTTVSPEDLADPSSSMTRGDYFQDLKGSLKQCPTSTVEGIDVADGNSSIDWQAMSAAGVRFTFIKATQGTYNTQKRFQENWANTKQAHVLRGAYHFFDPTEDGAAQANHFLAKLGGELGDLPAVIDLECPNSDAHCLGGRGAGSAPGAAIAQRLQDWLDTVEQATGRKPIVYTFPSYLSGAGVNLPSLKNYPLWIASPNGSSCASVPAPWTQAAVWQWSFHGKIPGHATELDRDRFVGTMDDLLKLGGGAAPAGCTSDADCNGGAPGTGKICDAQSQQCAPGCHADADCLAGQACHGGACAAAPKPGCATDADCGSGQVCSAQTSACVAAPAPTCASDADCNGGHGGTGKVCSAQSATCVPGCHADADCLSGQSCDKGAGACVAAAPSGCKSSADCGSGQVCSSGSCVAAPPAGCQSSSDCPAGETCDTASGKCLTGSSSGCAPLTFPSGQTLATVPDSALMAEYEALGVSSCTLPACFIDAANLTDASGAAVDIHVKLSTHFALYEIVKTEVDPNGTGGVDAASAYSTRVLVSPDLVAHLEALRVDYGAPVNLTSGFRSPKHQQAVCQQVCGASSCPGTCAKNSRHMWGAAADMGLMYESAATQASFPFVFHEGGGTAPHLHVDMQACN